MGFLEHLPQIEIDKHRMRHHEVAEVTFKPKEDTPEYTRAVLFVEGIEPKGYATGGGCPTLVAFASTTSKDRLWGLMGWGVTKKAEVLIPVDFIIDYRTLEEVASARKSAQGV